MLIEHPLDSNNICSVGTGVSHGSHYSHEDVLFDSERAGIEWEAENFDIREHIGQHTT